MGRISEIDNEQFDVAIIGGGIIGCGIARDAALRGFRVALFDRRDFGSGTTSASTRIVHGGLRYLQMLDFKLVRLDLRERETLLRIAPHLVQPLEFLIPFFHGDHLSSLKLRAGLALYDALSFDKSLPSRRWLSAREARRAEPLLDRPDTRGAAAYYDARIDLPERLALENVIDAEMNGAAALNYCEVVSVGPHDRGHSVVRLRDTIDGSEGTILARAVVNATGAWFESVAESLLGRKPGVIRTTKGIHIVCAPAARGALALFSRVDSRLLFAIPRAGLMWLGTTDTDYAADPAAARASREDVAYILKSLRHVFPALTMDDVLFTTAGVRALVRQPGSASRVSRMHRVVEGPPVGAPSMISVLGGKITGYRAIAESVVDVLGRKLGDATRKTVTAETPLPGARGEAATSDGALDERADRHLRQLYGSRAAAVTALTVADPSLKTPLTSGSLDIGAQVVFGVRHEHCLRLSDFVRRRTLLGASHDQGAATAQSVGELMARELGWSAARTTAELAAFKTEVDAASAFRREG